MSKPEKLFMQNTNISYALTNKINIGSARESFFVNQIKNYYNKEIKLLDDTIFSSLVGDFLVDNQYIFEVGGKDKKFTQTSVPLEGIKDITNSFVVADDIEMGFGNKIPLWLFGFLYWNLRVLQSDRKNVGFIRTKMTQQYKEYDITIKEDTQLCIATDGIVNQEGLNDTRYGKKEFERLILRNSDKTTQEQKEEFINIFETFKGDIEQSDDVTVVGLKF